MKYLHYSFILFFLCVLASCTSKESNTSILTGKNWNLKSVIAAEPVDLNSKGTLSTDLNEQTPACTHDDIYSFKPDNDFNIDDHENTCGGSERDSGAWKLIGNDTLAFDFKTDDRPDISFRIVEINAGKMVLRANMPFKPGGVDVTYTFIPTGK